MLREILTNGYVDKNIYLSQKSLSPKKSDSKLLKPGSFKQLNFYQTQKNLNFNSKPIFDEKIEMIKQRPDYILNQNNESTNPTMNNNKQFLYSNEKTKNIKASQNINNLNMKDIYNNNNEYSDIGELDSNNNNIENLNEIIINNNNNPKPKSKPKKITTLHTKKKIQITPRTKLQKTKQSKI